MALGHDGSIAPVRIVDADGHSAAVIQDGTGTYRLAVDASGSTMSGLVQIWDGVVGHTAGLVWDAGAGLWRLAVDAQLVVAANVAIDGNIQVQNDERALAILNAGTWNGASRDCQNYADFAVSVFLSRNAANDTTVDVVVECSKDGATWRQVDRQVLTINAANTTQNLNRNYTATRRYMRVSLVNNTNPVDAEVVTNLKPIG